MKFTLLALLILSSNGLRLEKQKEISRKPALEIFYNSKK